ncbi:MAG: amino acid adenylation domain-containing protein, partial [Anaerolineae bacterium]|nr:amino acid adenylation domain-containing protein [Anaerolineae bacterium]
AYIRGVPASLPDIPIQYADFASWQRQWLQGDGLAEQLAYWQRQLAHAPALLSLPTDQPRPPQMSHRGASMSFTIPKQLSQRLQNLSQQAEATLFMTLLAAFKVLLYRYTGQTDLLIGTPTAGRPQQRFEETIGYFINMVVIRSQVEATTPFLDYLKQLQLIVVDALDHSAYPFPRLVAELELKPDPALSPLFQVAFAFQNFVGAKALQALADPGQEGLPFELLDEFHQAGEFDLMLEIFETEEDYRLQLKYNPDLFDPSTIERMLGHYTQLMTEIVAAPGKATSGYDLLPAVERDRLLVEWNDTQAEYPQDQCIHHLFEAQVEHTPEAIAVVFGHQQLTYRELNCQVNQLAHHLRSLGVGPDILVGICVERSLEMVIGLLAILKAGGAYVPLDPTYPAERLAFMMDDAQASLLLTQSWLEADLPLASKPIQRIDLDTIGAQLADQPHTNPVHPTEAHHLAYVIYTSGSTGRPKGVMIEHRQVLNTLWALQRRYPMTANDGYLLKTNYGFDVSVCELFGWFMGGGRLAILELGGEKDPVRILEALSEQQISHVNFVPSMLSVFLETVSTEALAAVNSLKYVMVAGEAFPNRLAQIGQQKLPAEVKLENIYGPTETAIYATWYAIEPGDDRRSQIPIGRPLDNVQAYIMGTEGSLQPIGVPGELYIAGGGVARGYLNQPELTRAKFNKNPFGSGRVYKTGDLARWLPEGNIEFLGRVDHQVKIRGFRIELGEIEAHLSQNP